MISLYFAPSSKHRSIGSPSLTIMKVPPSIIVRLSISIGGKTNGVEADESTAFFLTSIGVVSLIMLTLPD
jgi:hypothetical protein